MNSKKLYKVVAVIGRRHNIIYQTKPFDTNDGKASYAARQEARQEMEKYCAKLWDEGYSRTIDGRYHHIGKNLDGGKIDIYLYSR